MNRIVGFYRVVGFDHAVRFVTDHPTDKYGRRYTLFSEGSWVHSGWMLSGELLPLDAMSEEDQRAHRHCEYRMEYEKGVASDREIVIDD